jgi:hypothetical protein
MQMRKNTENILTSSPTAHCLPLGLPGRYLNARPFKIFQLPETFVNVLRG